MRPRTATVLAAVLAVSFASLVATTTPASAAKAPEHKACSNARSTEFRCLSTWRRSGRTHRARGVRSTVTRPTEGYGPADIASAYQLTGGTSSGTVAIVDAYDNPNAEKDLAAYRSAFGLSACTTANHCFSKVDQRGGKTYPEGDPGWGVEISLDVQAVSAACPACTILLVEADDASFESIGAAVRTAVRLGADVVSNSYGADEFSRSSAYGQKYYYHPHTAIVASSGDYGFTAASFPATLNYVWAVGGTKLTRSSAGTWREQAWQYAGSGCSAYIPKPSFQKDANCSMRTTTDISAVADPDTGFAVYDTYGLGDDNGWIVVGGTSLAAPLISGMIARAGNAADAWKPSYAYGHASGLKDVVGGSNGYCGGDYLCTGLPGYDGPTGLGSPRGLSAL